MESPKNAWHQKQSRKHVGVPFAEFGQSWRAHLRVAYGDLVFHRQWMVDKAIAQSAKLTSVEYASDVEWLSEVIAKSKNLPVMKTVSRSCAQTEAISIGYVDWMERRATADSRMVEEYLGYDPEARRELPVVEVLSTTVDQEVVREHWRYRTHGEWVTEAFVLYPSSRDASDEHSSEMPLRPAAVVLHPTVEMSIDEPAGVRSSDGIAHGPRALGWHLAKLGFVVICPRNYLWPANDRIEAAAQSDLWKQLRLSQEGTSKMLGMGKMLYDVQVAADLLLDHGKADPNQLSVLGHSLGAKEALYAMAFDERFRAGAASEGGIGIGFSNWDAEWYLGSEVKQSSFSHEHHELLALIAPRAFLVVAGDSAMASVVGRCSWMLSRDTHCMVPEIDLVSSIIARDIRSMNQVASECWNGSIITDVSLG